ncbi:MAG: hypothetical protein ACT4QE_24130 [Anaerolineales bacterium]
MRRRLAALLLAGLLGVTAVRALPALAEAAPAKLAWEKRAASELPFRFLQRSEAPPAPAKLAVYLPLVATDGTVDASRLPTLAEFIASVQDGQATVIRGVYVSEVLALPVQQQPGNDPTYVSADSGVVTQFGMASGFGVTGLLAHNYLAGSYFFELENGHPVSVVFGDGATKTYVVNNVQRYRALQPYSPYSDFIDLDTGEQLSATDLFLRVYTGIDHVTFQTCIELDGDPSGGRLFVIATPTP